MPLRPSRLLTLTAVLALAACDAEEEGTPTGATCPKGSALTWESFGESFMTTYCNGCHAAALEGADRHGAPKKYNFDTVEGARKHVDDIDRLAAAGPEAANDEMPPGPPKPSLAEREQLGQWLACGAP